MTAFLNTIILLGALQGFILGIMLYRRKNNRQSNRLLAFLLFVMALASLNLYFLNTRIFESTFVLRVISWVVPMVIAMPIGPLVYFYVRSVSDDSFRLTRKHRVQFYVGLIDIVPQIAAIIYIVGLLAGWLQNNPGPWGLFIDRYNMYVDIPRWCSVTGYLCLAYRYVKQEIVKPEKAEGDKRAALKWLQQFMNLFFVFQLLWLIHLVPYIAPATSNWLLNHVDWYPVYIPLSILIYWLGIKGYLFTASGAPGNKKLPATRLEDHIIHTTKNLLQKIMEEDKVYLDPALNLQKVAQCTGVAPKVISAVLNQHLHSNFTEWLNRYRIEEFKKRIREDHLQRLTISAIASECGFSSQATFQRIFRQTMGMSPTEYLKKLNYPPDPAQIRN